MTEETIAERIYPKELLPGDLNAYMHLARYELATGLIADVARVRGRRALVLDLGCGVGYGAEHVAKNSLSFVYGVDISPDAIQYARLEHDVRGTAFDVGDLTDWVPPVRADVALLFEVLEHLADPGALIAKLVTWGVRTVVASVPLRDPPDHNPYHRQSFRARDLDELVRPHFPDLEPYLQSIDEAPIPDPARAPEAEAFHALVVARR